MHHSFLSKSISLVAIVLLGILLSNALVIGISSLYGVQITSEDALFSLLSKPEHKGFVKAIIGLNHFVVFIVCPFVFYYLFYHKKYDIQPSSAETINPVQYFSLYHFNPTFLLLFPLALLLLYPLMAYLTFYVNQIPMPDFLSKMDDEALSALTKLLVMDSPMDLLVNIIIIGILPGIGEELLFRGVIQKELLSIWKNHHLAIWVTAILFSAFHFQITGFIPKMMIGLVLGYAYFLSRSLILPMIIHALNNIFSTVSLYFAGGMLHAEEIPSVNIPLIPVIASTMLFFGVSFFIYQIANKSPEYG